MQFDFQNRRGINNQSIITWQDDGRTSCGVWWVVGSCMINQRLANCTKSRGRDVSFLINFLFWAMSGTSLLPSYYGIAISIAPVRCTHFCLQLHHLSLSFLTSVRNHVHTCSVMAASQRISQPSLSALTIIPACCSSSSCLPPQLYRLSFLILARSHTCTYSSTPLYIAVLSLTPVNLLLL